MYYTKRVLAICLFLSLCTISKAQVSPDSIVENSIKLNIESAGVISGGDYAPFWITSNNYGIGSEDKNKAYIRTAMFTNHSFLDNKLRLSTGVDIIASQNIQSDFYFHQAFADLQYRSIGISFGAKERNNPFKNKELSSGDMTFSNNTRPMPQIELGLNRFVTVPLTKGWLQVQGAVSMGKFLDDKYKRQHAGNGNYTQKVLFHHKYGFMKIENNTPWNFIVGLEMNTQWGGDLYTNWEYTHSGPTKFKDFIKVFIPSGGGEGASESDKVNILGNVNGSWHFIFNYDKKDYTIKAYHEHFFEDKSGLKIIRNIPDGLYGVELNFKKKQAISSVLLEYLYTRNQSGSSKNSDGSIRMKGNDNYYNNGEYVSMTYYGHVLGNPLLTSPIYNNGRNLNIRNSRIIAYHLGLSGYLNDYFTYRTLFTFSKSYGSPLEEAPEGRKQFSSLVEVSYTNPKLEGWMFSGAGAYDNSSAAMVGDNVGIQLKVRKTFRIK